MLGLMRYRDAEMGSSVSELCRGKKEHNDHSHVGLIGKTLVMVEHSLVWEPRGRAAFLGSQKASQRS